LQKIKFSGVSDELWGRVEALIPLAERSAGRAYQRRPGGGRKPVMPRQVFSAIVYVLRTGCPWKALPRELGSASTVHRHFREWEQRGFFSALWSAGLAEHDEMAGICWAWESDLDAAAEVLPVIGSTGNQPRGSRAAEARPMISGRRLWRPAVARRERGRS
jgi:transposase